MLLGKLRHKRYRVAELFVLLLVGFAIAMSVLEKDYRLAADTTLEGAVRRAVVAPFDGFIDQAAARAGDRVEKGQLLCTLDDRDLRLEKLSQTSRRNQLEKQYQDAKAKHDRAQANIIRAKLDQAAAAITVAVA